MSKYSSELKSQIVSEYLAGNPTAELSNNYHVSKKRINKWVQLFRMNGSQALKRRRHKRVFTQDFKLNVINYYQTHEESLAEVGAKCQGQLKIVQKWQFENVQLWQFKMAIYG